MGRPDCPDLLQHAQSLALWRHQRDPEEQHRYGDPRALTMDFDLTEEQRLLKESLDRLIGDRYAFEQRKVYAQAPEGWSRELWAQYAELGLLGLPFAEQYGGSGGGPVETMITMEAFGRALALEPVLRAVGLGGAFL